MYSKEARANVRRMRGQGHTLVDIAHALGFSRATVVRILAQGPGSGGRRRVGRPAQVTATVEKSFEKHLLRTRDAAHSACDMTWGGVYRTWRFKHKPGQRAIVDAMRGMGYQRSINSPICAVHCP
jgi:transposase